MKKNSRNRQDRLLEVAAHLFRTKGYAATSIRDLAGRLGLESSSLYHYMNGKEELLFKICQQSLDELTQRVKPIVSSSLPPMEKLQEFIQTHISVILKDRDKHAVMLSELKALSAKRRKAIVKMRDGYEDLVLHMLTEGQEAGVIRSDLQPRYLKLALLNLLNWSIFWYRPGGPLKASAIGELLADVFLEGILVRQPQKALSASS